VDRTALDRLNKNDKMGFDSGFNPRWSPILNTTVTLDKAGRVVIPKSLREELHLEPGDQLGVESEGECVTLRPMRAGSALRKEHGVWVFRRGKKIPGSTTDDVLTRIREERDRSNRRAQP
jgi:AbrB family looped-hinge helix DNA binding protein